MANHPRGAADRRSLDRRRQLWLDPGRATQPRSHRDHLGPPPVGVRRPGVSSPAEQSRACRPGAWVPRTDRSEVPAMDLAIPEGQPTASRRGDPRSRPARSSDRTGESQGHRRVPSSERLKARPRERCASAVGRAAPHGTRCRVDAAPASRFGLPFVPHRFDVGQAIVGGSSPTWPPEAHTRLRRHPRAFDRLISGAVGSPACGHLRAVADGTRGAERADPAWLGTTVASVAPPAHADRSSVAPPALAPRGRR